MGFTQWLRLRHGDDLLGRLFCETLVEHNPQWPEDGDKEVFRRALPLDGYAPFLDKLWARYQRDATREQRSATL